jgi:hypothetical protein
MYGKILRTKKKPKIRTSQKNFVYEKNTQKQRLLKIVRILSILDRDHLFSEHLTTILTQSIVLGLN